jgi:hypothetical protein
MTPDMLAVRRRLLEDFSYYAPNALHLRTKTAETVPFVFNEAQRRLVAVIEKQYAAEGKVRVIILKARQMGLSTAVGGRLYSRVSQRKSKKAIVVTHKAESTQALFEMTQRFYEHTPEILKPVSKYSSRKELKFGVLDSGYAVSTAGGDGIGRGEMFTHAHLSELAFWPRSSAAANFNGLMQAIPNAPDTEVYIESTANGVSGLFYDQWQEAVSGRSGFIPLFLPWFIQDEYREPVGKDFKRSPEETKLVKLHKLDNEQLMFRRKKIAMSGADLFKQEYPCTADEAFLTTGRPVFNLEKIADMIAAAPPVLAQFALEGSDWEKHPRGELLCYRSIDPEEQYYIGADVGAGVQRDWSVAQVQDSQRRQVATFRAQVDPDYFATCLYHLGKLFNTARIIVERNNHGILTCTRLGKDMNYPDFYTEVTYDKVTDVETTQLGFFTSEKTKPLIIDKLRADIREDRTEIVDRETLKEMQSYVVTENGKMAAEKSCHDDTVMALALCNHINDGAWVPIVNQDEWFCTVE